MIIQSVKKDLESAKKPVAKSLHHNSGFRVLVIGFKKNMEMKEHSAKWPSKLTVLEGSVCYIESDKKIILNKYDEYNITPRVVHSVLAKEDSICLLTQSDELFHTDKNRIITRTVNSLGGTELNFDDGAS